MKKLILVAFLVLLLGTAATANSRNAGMASRHDATFAAATSTTPCDARSPVATCTNFSASAVLTATRNDRDVGNIRLAVTTLTSMSPGQPTHLVKLAVDNTIDNGFVRFVLYGSIAKGETADSPVALKAVDAEVKYEKTLVA